jgi:chemotaxis signal transduction protein
MDCFVFEAARRLMGIAARHIYRIVDETQPTPVPLLPACHMGILYYRGELFDVIDAGRLLDSEGSDYDDRSRYIILLKWDQRRLGLLPARIVGIMWIADAEGGRTAFTREGEPVQVITPQDIWQLLSDLPYGH